MSQPGTRPLVLVTGATAGIGLRIATGLAAGGRRVVITGRNQQAGEQAAAALRRQARHDQIWFVPVDHALVGANLRLAAWVADRFDRLDVLVNNVGGMPPRRLVTADGYESALAVNFVGPAALTGALLPLLHAGAPARVINVVSSAWSMWKRDPFEDLHATSGYVPLEVYGRAKLLNLLWTLALARRLGGEVTANAVNPGMAWTPMTRSLTPEVVPAWRYVWPIVRWFQRRRSPAAAARVPVFLASSPEAAEVTGAYFNERTTPTRLKAPLLDEKLQERAWTLGETLTAGAPTRAEV